MPAYSDAPPLWSLDAPRARNEVFNVTNGDEFRWCHMWSVLADFFDMPVADPQPMVLAEQMPAMAAVWTSLVARYGLIETPYAQIANWSFLDAVLDYAGDVVLSTIKIRQAGFAECIDTHESFKLQLQRLRSMRLIP